jgi:hypothetical protein
MAGYVRHVPLPAALATGELTHVIVQGAGHLAPRDQPERVGAMVRRVLGGGDMAAAMCDQAQGVCRASDVALRALGSRCALLYNCSGHGRCTDEGACACGEGWAGADCAEAVHDIDARGSGANATFLVRPDGWQWHRVRGGAARELLLYANTSALPRRDLPRAADGPAGLRVYLARDGQPWHDPDDLATSFAMAWRLEGTTAAAPIRLPRLDAGAVLGVHNAGSDGFHDPVRAYQLCSAEVDAVSK